MPTAKRARDSEAGYRDRLDQLLMRVPGNESGSLLSTRSKTSRGHALNETTTWQNMIQF